ncbi:AraC family ligand binding domain-containing protein [Rhizohabitans arisaemae]|uniref:AraC family ligand binding domain-containing protein n=1 Tax=Rhizohabitans arisaemae TaxID=2720610 RepID=UPI0024B24401|nr:AraC family ligand binding domain-containing protein [Rhizohabitans arisaemae]
MTSQPEAPAGPPNIDLYTRNGFSGPIATIVRTQYAPVYTAVSGTYAPHRLDVNALSGSLVTNGSSLPVPILEGTDVSVEVSHRTEPSTVAFRNVLADELHYVLEGEGRLETDFGVLEVRPGDMVLLPRSVTYRYGAITSPLREVVIVTASEMRVDPENAPGVLNVDLHVDAPVPDPRMGPPGDYKVIIRHGGRCTTYSYDYDPVPCLAAVGAPIVRRFNMENVHGLGVEKGGLMPPRLLNDATTRTLVFHLGNRRSDRPPVHHNADYDEVIFYVAGPGHYGAVDKPGTILWTPKGLIHHGPEEDVPEGYQAFLLETRAALSLTPAGREIAAIMETGQFDFFTPGTPVNA